MSEEKTTEQPWFHGLDPADVGHIQNRGWDKLSPVDAAKAAHAAFRGAERMIGAPVNELWRVPEDPNQRGEMWKRLGKPDAVEGYDFSTVKMGEQPMPDDLAASLRAAAHEANLPADAAKRMAEAFAGYSHNTAVARSADAATRVAAEASQLKEEWGSDYEQNRYIASRGATTMGLDPEAINTIEKAAGLKATMNALLKIGLAGGEARFLGSQPNPGDPNAGLTYEMARAQLDQLKTDQAWIDRMGKGDSAAFAEFERLTSRIAKGNLERRR